MTEPNQGASMRALTPTESASMSLIASAQDMAPDAAIKRATAIADTLSALIQKQQLFEDIKGRKFVTFEGWSTAMFLLGCTPREIEVIETDGVYTATVEYVLADGRVVARGSAECGRADDMQASDRSWRAAPSQARRGMAVTRAHSRAARAVASWIMTLAGYEPTPRSELPPDAAAGWKEDGSYSGLSTDADELARELEAVAELDQLARLVDRVNNLKSGKDRIKVGALIKKARARIDAAKG